MATSRELQIPASITCIVPGLYFGFAVFGTEISPNGFYSICFRLLCSDIKQFEVVWVVSVVFTLIFFPYND